MKTLETAINDLSRKKNMWAFKPISEKLEILNQIKKNFLSLSEAWVSINLKNKGITEKDPAISDEWISGPFPIVRYIRLLHDSLYEINTKGFPECLLS